MIKSITDINTNGISVIELCGTVDQVPVKIKYTKNNPPSKAEVFTGTTPLLIKNIEDRAIKIYPTPIWGKT